VEVDDEGEPPPAVAELQRNNWAGHACSLEAGSPARCC
jgi:hypothetical protein